MTNLVGATNALPFSAPLAGLTLGTTYHFRAAATNMAGVVYGSDQSFTTPRAPAYAVLKSFTGSDGRYPWAGLVLEGSTLYGTTTMGGTSFSPTNTDQPGNGLVFKMNVDGSGYTVLKNFTGSDGAGPVGRLLLAGSTLYGVADVVFKMNTDGSGYTVLKNFAGSDGQSPFGTLVLVGSTLYGVTYSGGHGYGVVFKVNTDGSGYTVLKYFEGLDGVGPWGGLVLGGSTLYGCTVQGGGLFRPSLRDYGYGVVFKLNTDGSGYTVLTDLYHACWYGYGDLILAGGTTLYGTAESDSSGGGAVFKVNTDGSGYTVVKNFGGSDGTSPLAGLVLAGGTTLYGTTSYGGSPGYGVVFKVNTDGSGYTVLKSFTFNDGAYPQADLLLAGGTLYGTASGGGPLDNPYYSQGFGLVFSLECLSITTPPLPLAQTVEAGTNVRYQVEASSLAPGLAYQWFFEGTNALVGATNALLELTNLQSFQAGAYTALVTSMGLAVTSTPALLSVISPVERRTVPAIGLAGGSGSSLHLEYADSLPAPPWLSLSTVTLGRGTQRWFDLSQPLPAQRFYRTWQTNGPQPALDMSLATEIPLAGAIGSSVEIDYINQFGPTNAWVTLDTVVLTNTTQLYFDVTAWQQPPRLYRVVPVP